jgi:predicted RNA-binding protein with RPS1 domain
MHIDADGKMSLSHKALLPGGENAHEEMKRSRERKKTDSRGSRDDRHSRPRH